MKRLTLIEAGRGFYNRVTSWKRYKIKEIECEGLYIERNLKIRKFLHITIIGVPESYLNGTKLVFGLRECKSWLAIDELLRDYFNIEQAVEKKPVDSLHPVDIMRLEDDGGPCW